MITASDYKAAWFLRILALSELWDLGFFFFCFAVTSVFNSVRHKGAQCEQIMFEDSLTHLKKINLLPVMKAVTLFAQMFSAH